MVEIIVEFEEEEIESTIAWRLATDPITLVKDDKETAATCYIGYEKPPETIRELFKKYDTIITVGLEEDVSGYMGLGKDTKLHTGRYRVRGWATDKSGITGKKMRWTLLQEIRRVIRKYATNPGGVVKRWKIVNEKKEFHSGTKQPLYSCLLMVETISFEKE